MPPAINGLGQHGRQLFAVERGRLSIWKEVKAAQPLGNHGRADLDPARASLSVERQAVA